jgi:hypothetical protein
MKLRESPNEVARYSTIAESRVTRKNGWRKTGRTGIRRDLVKFGGILLLISGVMRNKAESGAQVHLAEAG